MVFSFSSPNTRKNKINTLSCRITIDNSLPQKYSISSKLFVSKLCPLINKKSHFGMQITYMFPVWFRGCVAKHDKQSTTVPNLQPTTWLEYGGSVHPKNYIHALCFMMTSSNGNIFRVTDQLCGVTGHRWIPRTKASDAELWCFLWSAPE